jgi:hypothetical protein
MALAFLQADLRLAEPGALIPIECGQAAQVWCKEWEALSGTLVTPRPSLVFHKLFNRTVEMTRRLYGIRTEEDNLLVFDPW